MSRNSSVAPDRIGDQQAPWQDIVILCRECGGKLDGGFGDKGRDGLRSVLRDGLREAGRVLETLGVSPTAPA